MYKSEVKGKGCIVARVVADSVSSANGQRVTTFEVEYPRFLHSEVMTHRMFSRNAASSRAIPVEKMIEQVRNNPATPIHWGANQRGMQADKELSEANRQMAQFIWEDAAVLIAQKCAALGGVVGAHKQIVNRLLEPFQIMKTVITATEWNNFFSLRCHPDAQPEIQELANCMKRAMDESEPYVLQPGEWHLPYSDQPVVDEGCAQLLPLEARIKLSASCCAQVSYRALDQSLEKAVMIYDKLITSKPAHASPLEHQCTPMACAKQQNGYTGGAGVTHIDSDNSFWSGNLKGWVQHRQLIKDNVVKG